jgi:hypothetical protein
MALVVLVAILAPSSLHAQPKPSLRDIDRIRLAEAFRIGDKLGDRVWSGWSKAPFAVLLVTKDDEFLIRHPKPSPDFTPIGHDDLLKSDVFVRKRAHEPSLLATFPAITGSMIPTIVIGQAENTDKKTSTPWVITVLHEHFHQLQYSQPNYYADVEKLGLSHGDQTGMWMLNYPFPYQQPEVKRQIEALCDRLADLMKTEDLSELRSKLPAYLALRRDLEHALSPDDFRYFSFQVWQEGIARYTEYQIASLAAEHYKPSKAFHELLDYRPFDTVSEDLRTHIAAELSTLELDKFRRVAFYPIGAAEGLILDRVKPEWRRRYFPESWYVDRYF